MATFVRGYTSPPPTCKKRTLHLLIRGQMTCSLQQLRSILTLTTQRRSVPLDGRQDAVEVMSRGLRGCGVPPPDHPHSFMLGNGVEWR